MMRLLDRAIFDTLSISDKIRAYLVLRTTPASRHVLCHISGATEISPHLYQDIKQGRIRRTRPGQFCLTPKGRRYYAISLPIGLLGVLI